MQFEHGEKTLHMLKKIPQLQDGRWLPIPVTSESDSKDAEKLLLAKKRPPGTHFRGHGDTN